MADIANRFKGNPILRPGDIRPSHKGFKVECLLNPGVFRFRDKIWLLLRVAERPVQKDGVITLPILRDGEVEILEFDKSNPDLVFSDPRIIIYKGTTYLTRPSPRRRRRRECTHRRPRKVRTRGRSAGPFRSGSPGSRRCVPLRGGPETSPLDR